ncbi:MAG: hypothetical protein IRY91_09715 [Gemmatimonadaceae bacterium]|nr:hypothetical protein [Gemmatimonadaceae bacterium]
MSTTKVIGRGVAAATAGVLLGWAGWAAVTWARSGHIRRGRRAGELADRWLPEYEVDEAHDVYVAAPAEVTFAVATEMGMQRSAVARAMVRARERLMGARGGGGWLPGGIVTQMRRLGWSVLAEVPGRVVVLGTVTQPWHGDVEFHPVPADEFRVFDRPGFVKLVTVLAAEPLGPDASLFHEQTRVATTDTEARARFRRYWAVFSPGILLIRLSLRRLVKREAERRYREERESWDRGGARLVQSELQSRG